MQCVPGRKAIANNNYTLAYFIPLPENKPPSISPPEKKLPSISPPENKLPSISPPKKISCRLFLPRKISERLFFPRENSVYTCVKRTNADFCYTWLAIIKDVWSWGGLSLLFINNYGYWVLIMHCNSLAGPDGFRNEETVWSQLQ